ncbi:MAG: NHL repeat-containing protein [Desulfobacteraceae bacterium]
MKIPSHKLFILGTMLLATAWAQLSASAAEKVRFRHALSLYADDQGIGFQQPQGVACTQNSVMVVADTGNDRLLRYTLSDYESKPQVQVLKTPLTIYPKKIHVGRQGEIYLLDAKAGRIVHLSADGQSLGFIKPVGMPAPARIEAPSFAVDPNGRLYFLDVLSRRVLVCNDRGQYLRQIQFPETYGWISDIAVSDREEIFLVDSVNAQVFAARTADAPFTALSQSLEQYMRFPTSLAIDQRGRLYLNDRNGSKIVILSADGAYVGRLSAQGWRDGLLNHPSQLCVNERGDLIVADTSNNRVQIFYELK